METSPAATLLMNEQRRKETKTAKAEKPSDAFDFQLRSYGLPAFVREHQFAKEKLGRRWALDFACMQYMLAVEIEGIVVQRVHIATLGANGRVVKTEPQLIVRGRHASVDGFNQDAIKYASAAMLGWTLIRFTPKQVKDGVAIDYTQRVLCAKGWQP